MKSPRYDIGIIDIKSFYASLECVERGLNPLTAKLCVVGDLQRDGSVCLASSPLMKSKYGIKTGSRLYEIKAVQKWDKEIIVVQSRMKAYLQKAKDIVDLYLTYVPKTHLHVYSVDESWLTLTGCLFGRSPRDMMQLILDDIKNRFGLVACAGIGDNKFLAKIILDVEGKQKGIAECRMEDVPTKLHPLPIEDMLGIGSKLKQRMHSMGIFTIGSLAHYDQQIIKEQFGKNGLILQQYANGIDFSPVVYNEEVPPDSVFGFDSGLESKKQPKSIGKGVTLLEPRIKEEDVLLVIRDLVDEICEELRRRNLSAKKVHLTITYNRNKNHLNFSRQKMYSTPSNLESELYARCRKLYEHFRTKKQAVRHVEISVGHLEEDVLTLLDEQQNKEKKLADVKDLINELYGKGTIRRASSFKKNSIAPERIKKTKGHY